MKYLIENAKVEIGGGMACGPVSGPVIGEVILKDETGKNIYYLLEEVEGFPWFMKTEESVFERELTFDDVDDELIEYRQKHQVGVSEYEEFEDYEEEDKQILLYLTYIVRSSWEDCERFIAETKGMDIFDVEIPEMSFGDDDWYEDEEEE